MFSGIVREFRGVFPILFVGIPFGPFQMTQGWRMCIFAPCAEDLCPPGFFLKAGATCAGLGCAASGDVWLMTVLLPIFWVQKGCQLPQTWSQISGPNLGLFGPVSSSIHEKVPQGPRLSPASCAADIPAVSITFWNKVLEAVLLIVGPGLHGLELGTDQQERRGGEVHGSHAKTQPLHVSVSLSLSHTLALPFSLSPSLSLSLSLSLALQCTSLGLPNALSPPATQTILVHHEPRS